MESIEVWHAEHLPAPAIVSSYDRLKEHHPCISVAELLPSYEPFDLWNASVTERWHRALDVMSASELLIPEAALSVNTVGRSVASSTSIPTTNGLASGNDRVEAICHSAFEIIERHSFTTWYEMGADKRANTSIDLSGIGGLNGGLIKRIRSADLQLNVFDLSEHSLGLP
jgi:YcaO-like protein with predicted kinase domain